MTRARAHAAPAKPVLFVVVLAGGRGTRFWPRSRRALPKQFLTLGGGRTLLQATIDRVEPLVPRERILVVTTRDLVNAVRKDLPRLPRRNIVVEPVGRNTAPAIGLAAHVALGRAENPILVVMPSDHHVKRAAAFRRAVSESARLVTRDEDALVTFGIPPTRPETGYGYIQAQASRVAGRRARATMRRARAASASARATAPMRVRRFIEKPDAARAKRLLASADVFWNSGVFVWRARTYLDALARHAPRIASGLERIREREAMRDGAGAAARLYARLPSISADYAVLERARRVFVIPLDAGWNDVGSWIALAEVASKDARGNVVEGEHVALDESTRDSIFLAPGKLIATIGIEGLIAVDTGDVLFLCDATRAQDVRRLVALLARKGFGSRA